MSTMTTPAGMAVEVRGLTGRDGRYLTNEKLVRDNDVEDYILRGCCPSLVDPGFYTFEDAGIDWGRVLVGDRVFLLIAIREETYPGEPYVMKLTCPAKMCRAKFEWQIDIAKLLKEKVKPLSPEDRELLKKGEPAEVTVPGLGNRVRFRPKTGADVKRFMAYEQSRQNWSAKKKERINKLVDNLLFHGIEIEGIDKKAPSEKKLDFLEGLGFREINLLRQEIEKHDCGVDTTIGVECPQCGVEWEINLPFGRDFFVPEISASSPKRETEKDETDDEDDASAAQ